MAPTLWTIGHSTRALDLLASLLREHGVQVVVDVRRFPRGKRQPHLSRESLEAELPARGIAYLWMGESLGGFRRGGYEEYVRTPEFEAGVSELGRVAAARPAAVMCAEVVWFRCHRRHIARVLNERGWKIVHIVDERKAYVDDPGASGGEQRTLPGTGGVRE